MALSPFNTDDVELELDPPEITPFRTYEYDFVNQRFTGSVIDNLAAIKQFALKAIITARYRHLAIYSTDYGSELSDLLGESMPNELRETEIERYINEALIGQYDDIVTSCYDFTFDHSGDSVKVNFKMQVDYSIIEMEVNLDG